MARAEATKLRDTSNLEADASDERLGQLAIEDEMRSSCPAITPMSVIVRRTVSDVRDGLKPVHLSQFAWHERDGAGCQRADRSRRRSSARWVITIPMVTPRSTTPLAHGAELTATCWDGTVRQSSLAR